MTRETFQESDIANNLEKQQEIFNLLKNVEIIDPNDNLSKASALIEDGYIGIFASDHKSHADLLAVYTALSQIQSKVDLKSSKGIHFIYAKSIDTGDQGNLVKQIFAKFKQFLPSHKIFPLPVVRKKDEEKYGMEPEIEGLKKILSIPDEGSSFFVFPEATLEGGRKDHNGKPKGLQSAKEARSVNKVCQMCVKKGKKIFSLSMTIIDSDLVFDPDSGVINFNQKFQIIVGNILFENDLMNQGKEPVDVIMKEIASNLPEERRGEYK